MEIGLFTEFQCPPGMEEARAFDESLAEMTAAEDLGFEALGYSTLSVWMNVGGRIPDERVLASMRRFAERVIPRLPR